MDYAQAVRCTDESVWAKLSFDHRQSVLQTLEDHIAN